MRLTINGEQTERPDGSTVTDLLKSLGLSRDGVAVAVNRRVVPRTAHPSHQLQAGDRVEVIQAVGGG
jgi:sulfur carrier protein